MPSFQVIFLGSGGGPFEDNVTGFLVRSTATKWAANSVLAVDAGVHLAAVKRIFVDDLPNAYRKNSVDYNHNLRERTGYPGMKKVLPSPCFIVSTGPFTDLELPSGNAKADATYFMQNLVATFLITHPHLDHISGLVINTAALQCTSEPKKIAGLPATITAFKKHIFNDIIWPNMSDEDGGIGLVSFIRLPDGRDLVNVPVDGSDYVDVCNGLSAKCWSISHGENMRSQSPRFRHDIHKRSKLMAGLGKLRTRVDSDTPPRGDATFVRQTCVNDSSAFFLRDIATGHEILIWGDVEPDTLSLSPRNAQVWADAASKIVAGKLKGILIECSYDESRPDGMLFGHLSPRHVITELEALAEQVHLARFQQPGTYQLKKNKIGRANDAVPQTWGQSPSGSASLKPVVLKKVTAGALIGESHSCQTDRKSCLRSKRGLHEIIRGNTDEPDAIAHPKYIALHGLPIVIVHVKDTSTSESDGKDTLLGDLEAGARRVGLGCKFKLSEAGSALWF